MNYSLQKAAAFASLKQRHCFLVEFRLLRNLNGSEASLYSLSLRLVGREPGIGVLAIHFDGVRDIRIGDLTGIVGLLLRVESVTADQLEGIHFSVAEDEYAAFSFSCTDFNWEVINSAEGGASD